MSPLEAVVVVLCFVQLTFAAFNCSIPPIYIDIHVREVQGTTTFEYGSFFAWGEQEQGRPQNQSLWPSFNDNETTVAGVDYCNGSDDPACANNTHGFFEPQLSGS